MFAIIATENSGLFVTAATPTNTPAQVPSSSVTPTFLNASGLTREMSPLVPHRHQPSACGDAHILLPTKLPLAPVTPTETEGQQLVVGTQQEACSL